MTEIEDDEWSARHNGDNVMAPGKLEFTAPPKSVVDSCSDDDSFSTQQELTWEVGAPAPTKNFLHSWGCVM